MSLFDKMESRMPRKASRFPNLMVILVGAYALGFVLQYISSSVFSYLVFDPYLIMKGQVWRLVTFVLYPNGSNIFLAFITCFIYFSISRSLEMIIGRFRLNFFLISGLILLVLFGFLFYALFPYPYKNEAAALNPYYLYAMLFVLFAMIYPDARFLLMFIIPIKGKWMVFITLALYSLEVIQAFVNGWTGYGWLLVFMIIAAVLTVVLFMLMSSYHFGGMKNGGRSNTVRMQAYRRAANGRASEEKKARHKCAVCGRTELTNPELEFRYCTKCVGNYEYCLEHLYTHRHVTPGGHPES